MTVLLYRKTLLFKESRDHMPQYEEEGHKYLFLPWAASLLTKVSAVCGSLEGIMMRCKVT